MKLTLITFISIVLFACNSDTTKNSDANKNLDASKTSPEEKPLTLEGAWELVGFYNYIDNKVVDSFDTNTGYRQVKIYTPTKVMWSKHVPSDSTEWFGYGSYSINDRHLSETLEYGSEMMSKIIQERKEFIYELQLTRDRFSQIEIDGQGNRIYSENYKRIE